ncbi:amino acid/polyamine/organocation transporter, APC superfamily [Microbulbifer donghaiensis]|uniref:Amino acid/polyamine/organocation transporter, APC superfamily n=1 Tax=Microbulbifer donghaiensis TaxID=494016 RepID=A0A1M5AUI8_9GAMM|nr:APC family permease [Microbulbifer donghaiensis]SHF33921.1 amino acid/polyamine/organocation transporter, APC superfamily [Microbulbifer donghaiensis]
MTTVGNHKALKLTDLILYTVSASLLLETLAGAAAIGVSSIFWWIFLGLVFYVPIGLISAELGTAWPEHGGIYAWMRRAFGGRWATRAIWGYWINNAMWMPAIFILFAGVFSQLFAPDLSLTWQITMGIVLSWVAVAINVVTLDIGKWIPNLGAILKMVIFAAVIAGCLMYVGDHGMANAVTLKALTPDWSNSLQYIPVIIYGLLGFELMCANSDAIERPARNVPRAVLLAGITIISLYTLGTWAVLTAIPLDNINLVEGLLDTLRLFFGGSAAGNALVLVLGTAALFTFLSNGVTWCIGVNTTAAAAANDGELPAFLGIEHPRYGTPVGAAIATGCISTVVLLLYGFMAGSNEELFWSLFAFSAVLFLLPYIGMVLAFLKLRSSEAATPRPYRVPGGSAVATLLAWTCVAILALSVTLFCYTPGEGVQWPVLIGALVAIAVGEILIAVNERAQRAATAAATAV